MTSISSITLEVPDPAAATAFYSDVLGSNERLRLRTSHSPTSGFRGFTLSLVVSQPATVDALLGTAFDAGATTLKPVAKSFWGYGGVVQAPDGTIWKVATSSKKNTGPATGTIDEIALLVGAADVATSKRFYVNHGFSVVESFGNKYVQFDGPSNHVTLALYRRRALAKDAGVPLEGTGSHRIVVASESGPLADPDGFMWENA